MVKTKPDEHQPFNSLFDAAEASVSGGPVFDFVLGRQYGDDRVDDNALVIHFTS